MAATITIRNPDHSGRTVLRATLNGHELAVQSGRQTLPKRDLQGHLDIVLGDPGQR